MCAACRNGNRIHRRLIANRQRAPDSFSSYPLAQSGAVASVETVLISSTEKEYGDDKAESYLEEAVCREDASYDRTGSSEA